MISQASNRSPAFVLKWRVLKKTIMREKDICVSCGRHRSELSEIPWSHNLGNGELGIKCKDCHRSEIAERKASFSGDTEYTDDIICPFCGEKHEQDSETRAFYEDGSHDFDCGYCNEKFTVETSISYSYSTYKNKF